MTTIKVLSAGLIVTAMLMAPVTAHENCVTEPHAAVGIEATVSAGTRCIDGRLWIPAPHAGAFAATPSHQPDGICDFGDNPMIC